MHFYKIMPCIFLLLLLEIAVARAGSAGGPYILWINLSTTTPENADQAIKSFVNSNAESCWPDGALLYMNKRPKGITNQLVKNALISRKIVDQRRLRTILGKSFDEVPSFDGVIVYTDSPQPRLLSIGLKNPVKRDNL